LATSTENDGSPEHQVEGQGCTCGNGLLGSERCWLSMFAKCKLIINTRLQQSIMKRHKNSIPHHGMSLGDLHPDIASRWHPEKNGELKPTDVKPKSNRKTLVVMP
jgi:hypothetical protein